MPEPNWRHPLRIHVMFERTLADLIRGLRASSKKDEPAFIAKAVDEIRTEVKSKDMELKAAAILKLVYVGCITTFGTLEFCSILNSVPYALSRPAYGLDSHS